MVTECSRHREQTPSSTALNLLPANLIRTEILKDPQTVP